VVAAFLDAQKILRTAIALYKMPKITAPQTTFGAIFFIKYRSNRATKIDLGSGYIRNTIK
jgi:hypothetical protein